MNPLLDYAETLGHPVKLLEHCGRKQDSAFWTSKTTNMHNMEKYSKKGCIIHLNIPSGYSPSLIFIYKLLVLVSIHFTKINIPKHKTFSIYKIRNTSASPGKHILTVWIEDVGRVSDGSQLSLLTVLTATVDRKARVLNRLLFWLMWLVINRTVYLVYC